MTFQAIRAACIAAILLCSVSPASRAADGTGLPPAIEESIVLLGTAPTMLIVVTGSYHVQHGAWPATLADIQPALDLNKSSFPASFAFTRVTFQRKGKRDCVIEFEFNHEGFSHPAQGSITMRPGRSIAEILKAAKIKWRKKPTITVDNATVRVNSVTPAAKSP